MREEDDRRRREGSLLHAAVFGRPPPAGFVERYAAACGIVFAEGDGSDADRRVIGEAVRSGADLEALEFAWRRSDRRNPLSKRLAIVLYLAEATPDGYAAFVAESEARLGAWFALSGHLVRGIWKWFKGRALLRRLRATAAG